jgi:hypothetical protein
LRLNVPAHSPEVAASPKSPECLRSEAELDTQVLPLAKAAILGCA